MVADEPQWNRNWGQKMSQSQGRALHTWFLQCLWHFGSVRNKLVKCYQTYKYFKALLEEPALALFLLLLPIRICAVKCCEHRCS